MIEEKEKFKSIFDVIEEREEEPYIFGWSKNESLMSYPEEYLLYTGELISIEGQPPENKRRKYVLTQDALIRCKVLSIVNSNRNPIPTPINWP